MRHTRRHFVASSAASLCAAACSRRPAARPVPKFADPSRLTEGWRVLNLRARPGLMNMGVMDLNQGRVWYADDKGNYPLGSLGNLLTAACGLSQVDEGKLRLNEKLQVARDDLAPPPGLVNAQFVHETAPLNAPVADLIALAIQHDDNTAADSVLRRIGGPGAVTSWLKARGLEGLRLDSYSRQRIPEIFGLGGFRPEWADESGFARALEGIPPAEREEAMDRYLADSRDTATVPGMIGFLDKLASGQLLSGDSTRFLMALMSDRSETSRDLIAGLAPGSTFASAGYSSHTSLGLTPADNRAGIATLPDGRRLAMAVFLVGSTATATQRAQLMADAARLLATAG